MSFRRFSLALVATAALVSAMFQPSIAQTTPTATPLAATAATAVPGLVPFSGTLTEGDGKAVSGETAVTFLVFKDQNGGEPLFAETQAVVPDASGRYKVQLGATLANGLPADLFASGEARWLEVQAAGQAPQPRVLMASVPYAMKAADASTLGGLPASAFVLAGSKAAGNFVSNATTTGTTVTTTGGTAGYVPEFTGASTIVDSPVFVSGSNVGIGTTTPTATLDVSGTALVTGLLTANGGATVGGALLLSPTGTATAKAGFNSQLTKIYTSAYNSSSKSVVQPHFEWAGEVTGNNTASPSVTLNLLSTTTSASPTETGFYFNANGTINFAAGQTFPGADITGTVNASGYDLGGSTFAFGSQKNANAYLGFQQNTSGTGTENTGIGDGALGAGNGSGNSALGFAALPRSLAGGNTAIGTGALFNNTTGSNNTASGLQALINNSSGSANTGLGYYAGPDSYSFALSNSTAIGANATVSQSNTLVLGQTSAGSPGSSYVNVGIGTATPISTLEASVHNPGGLGPVLTLTNSVPYESQAGAAAVDFNTYQPVTSGTYNPSSRIEAVDDGNASDFLLFEANANGAANQGLQTNMAITPTGLVGVGLQNPSDISYYAAQLVVFGVGLNRGGGANGGVFATGADGSSSLSGGDGTYSEGGAANGSGNGGDGIQSFGGPSAAAVTDNNGGVGGTFQGGNASNGYGGYGILAIAGTGATTNYNGYAGYFEGNVYATGTISGAAKNFRIDHPLDPANKYLVHTSVESSEMMNIYSGNVVTDELGLATVKLPDWFEAENTDFRYQLTLIGQFAQAIVKDKIAKGQFRIMTNASRVEVSWQITAVRQDAYAKANPMVVEEEKPAQERGFYQNPEVFGQPAEKQTEWARHPQRMTEMREREKQQGQPHQTPTLRHEQPASAVNKNFAVPERPAVSLPKQVSELRSANSPSP